MSALKLGCVCIHCFEGAERMNGFVCLLMFVFCVCLTAVALSGPFANMLVHERRQASRETQANGGATEKGSPRGEAETRVIIIK